MTKKYLQNVKSWVAMMIMLIPILFTTGCGFWGGVATGVAATGAGYEYTSKKQLDRLEEDYKAGNITKEEYDARKKAIEEGSIIY